VSDSAWNDVSDAPGDFRARVSQDADITGGGPSPLTASDSARRSGVPENRMFWFTAADAVGAN